MPGIVGINQVNVRQQKDTMDKIAQGLGIANSLLGVSLAVPEYLQKRETNQLEKTKTQSEINALTDPNSTQNLQKTNLQGDISEENRKRTPLNADQKNSVRTFLQGNGVTVNSDFELPETVGQWETLRNTIAGRTVVTPAQQEGLNISKESLALRKSEASKAEEERRLNREGATSQKFLSGGFGARMLESEKNFNELESQGFNRADVATSAQSALPNIARTPAFQRQDQAERNFVNATLRRESGAAISQSEFDNAQLQYFPRAGDSPEVLKQKKENRVQAIRSMLSEAGPEVRKQVLRKDLNSFYDDLLHGFQDTKPTKPVNQIIEMNGKRYQKVNGGYDEVK